MSGEQRELMRMVDERGETERELIAAAVRKRQPDDRRDQLALIEPVALDIDGDQPRDEIVARRAPPFRDHVACDLGRGSERPLNGGVRTCCRHEHLPQRRDALGEIGTLLGRNAQPLVPDRERKRQRKRRDELAASGRFERVDQFVSDAAHHRAQRLDVGRHDRFLRQAAQARVLEAVVVEHQPLPPVRHRPVEEEPDVRQVAAELRKALVGHELLGLFVAQHRVRVEVEGAEVRDGGLRVPIRLARPSDVRRIETEAFRKGR